MDHVYPWINGLRLWKFIGDKRAGSWVPDGKLDIPEFEALMEIIEEEPLIAQIGSGTFGLAGYSMRLFYHPEVPGVPPSHAMTLAHEHLPEEFGEGNGTPEGREFYEWVWTLFTTFTHSERNIEWLKMYKMELPRERSHYDY